MPLLHGSQGCTSFGLMLFVRHFKEAMPLQTTAMSEVATVLGGYDNVEQAILNIYNKTKPEIIGICSTGVTETKGDDVEGYIKLIRAKHPQLAKFPLVYVSTPDFKDAFQDGWEKTVARMVEVLVDKPPDAGAARSGADQRAARLPSDPGRPRRVAHHHRGFRTGAIVPAGPCRLARRPYPRRIHADHHRRHRGRRGRGDGLRRPGPSPSARRCAARPKPCRRKTGMPFRVFERLCGLVPNDDFIMFLSEISGRPVPLKYRRQRGQLADAMLDAHFHIGGRKLAIGAEPDLLFDLRQHAA